MHNDIGEPKCSMHDQFSARGESNGLKNIPLSRVNETFDSEYSSATRWYRRVKKNKKIGFSGAYNAATKLYYIARKG